MTNFQQASPHLLVIFAPARILLTITLFSWRRGNINQHHTVSDFERAKLLQHRFHEFVMWMNPWYRVNRIRDSGVWIRSFKSHLGPAKSQRQQLSADIWLAVSSDPCVFSILPDQVNGFGIINTIKLESRSPNTSRHRRHWPWPHRPPVTLEHLRALFRRLHLANTSVASTFGAACVLAFWSCGRETQSGAKSLDSSDCVQKTTETGQRANSSVILWTQFLTNLHKRSPCLPSSSDITRVLRESKFFWHIHPILFLSPPATR